MKWIGNIKGGIYKIKKSILGKWLLKNMEKFLNIDHKVPNKYG
jgi:hypothetical protein